MPAIDRSPDLLDHVAERHDVLALEVPALLREDLVFDLDAGGTRAFEHAHGARHVHRIAKTGVGIGEHRDRNGIADRRDVFREFAESHEADVGNAKRHVGDASAGDVNPLEAKILDHPREQRIRRAGQNYRALGGEQCLEPRRQTLRFGGSMHGYGRLVGGTT